METTTNTVANEAVETKAVETKVEKKAVKRVAPKKAAAKAEKKVETKKSAVKKPAEKKAEKKPTPKAEKKPVEKKPAEKKKVEAKPVEKKPALREEAEKFASEVKSAEPLIVRCYQESDVIADRDRDISIEMRQKNPFAISANRAAGVRNMVIAYTPVPIAENDKSRRGSLWEMNITRTGKVLMLGDTLYEALQKIADGVKYTYKREMGWDLKNVLTFDKEVNLIPIVNKLNAVYAKAIK